MDDLLVRIAKPGQRDHYVPQRRAIELEADGWSVVTEEPSSLVQAIEELTRAVLLLQSTIAAQPPVAAAVTPTPRKS